jgi:uncharacterized membrane protein (UPF0127 family)
LAWNSQTPDEVAKNRLNRFQVENRRRLRQSANVKFAKFFALFLAVALAAGCHKTETAPAESDTDSQEPTHAQPKLPMMMIYLGAETLDAELATTPREEQTGMMFRTNVTDESAMLFVLREPIRAPYGFWMTNCPVSLSAAYIGSDGVIEEIHHLEKNDNVPVVPSHDNIVFVLEVNDGWFQRHNVGTGTLIRTEIGSLQQTFFPNRQ